MTTVVRDRRGTTRSRLLLLALLLTALPGCCTYCITDDLRAHGNVGDDVATVLRVVGIPLAVSVDALTLPLQVAAWAAVMAWLGS